MLTTYFSFSRSMPVKRRDERVKRLCMTLPDRPTAEKRLIHSAAPAAVLFIDYLLDIFLFVLSRGSVKGLFTFLGTGQQHLYEISYRLLITCIRFVIPPPCGESPALPLS